MEKTMSDATKQRRVEERGLLEKCRKVALRGKTTHWSQTDCVTHVKWEYRNGGLEVFFESGTFHLGNGEEIRVTHDGKEVFHVYDGATKKDKYSWWPTFAVKKGMDEMYVRTYVIDDWEEEIDVILRESA